MRPILPTAEGGHPSTLSGIERDSVANRNVRHVESRLHTVQLAC